MPAALEITSGKNAISVVITTRGASPAPSVTTMIGAMATMGVDWITTSQGITVRDSRSDRVMPTASGSAMAMATA